MAQENGPVTDAEMEKVLRSSRQCSLVLMRQGSCYLPGPGGPAEVSLNPHVRFMLRLKKEGMVLFSGPVTDSTGIRWMAVFASGDHLTVRDYMEDDPDVISGRLKYEIHPWTML
jgi:uncharacterized protein YciI